MTDGLRTYDSGVAIVTGAASGIGRAISEALALRGCQVVLADVDLEEAESTAVHLRERGGRASARRLDVSSFAEINELVAHGSRLARRNFERYRKLVLDSGATTHGESNRDAV